MSSRAGSSGPVPPEAGSIPPPREADGSTPSVRLVVGALIRGDRVLLVRRAPTRRFYPDMWDLFGGHVESGESAEDALRREGREELGVDIESFGLLGTDWDPVERVGYAVFSVSSWSGEPVNAAPDEHTEIGWFSAEALPRSPALDHVRELVLRAMVAGADGPLDATATDGDG